LASIFFKLVTFKIIKELGERGETIRYKIRDLNSLWFVDDSAMKANTVEAARKYIILLKEMAGKFCLEINSEKSNIVVSKGKINFKEIEGIEVVIHIKFL